MDEPFIAITKAENVTHLLTPRQARSVTVEVFQQTALIYPSARACKDGIPMIEDVRLGIQSGRL